MRERERDRRCMRVRERQRERERDRERERERGGWHCCRETECEKGEIITEDWGEVEVGLIQEKASHERGERPSKKKRRRYYKRKKAQRSVNLHRGAAECGRRALESPLFDAKDNGSKTHLL